MEGPLHGRVGGGHVSVRTQGYRTGDPDASSTMCWAMIRSLTFCGAYLRPCLRLRLERHRRGLARARSQFCLESAVSAMADAVNEPT